MILLLREVLPKVFLAHFVVLIFILFYFISIIKTLTVQVKYNIKLKAEVQ